VRVYDARGRGRGVGGRDVVVVPDGVVVLDLGCEGTAEWWRPWRERGGWQCG